MIRLVGFVLVATLTTAGCGARAAPATKLSVVTSFYPLYEFTQRLGGDRVQLRNLVPAGAEPHDYEPTPQDIKALANANLMIYNGAGFEPWVTKLLPQLPENVVKIEATKDLSLAKTGAGLDPHVWLDPILAQQQVDNIVAGLIRVDPDGKALYDANAAKLKQDLQALHRRFTDTLRTCQQKTFITSHDAFGYLARRYALQPIAISGLSPEAEPSPTKLKELAILAKRHGVQVIYAETLVGPRVAEAIAREVRASVRVLNPVEGLTAAELNAGKNYFTVMDENLRSLAEGLNCH